MKYLSILFSLRQQPWNLLICNKAFMSNYSDLPSPEPRQIEAVYRLMCNDQSSRLYSMISWHVDAEFLSNKIFILLTSIYPLFACFQQSIFPLE